MTARVDHLRTIPRDVLLRGDWTNPVERCPQCGAQLLVNVVRVKWCSAYGCAYVKPAADNVSGETALKMYVVTENPSDFPGKCVVRIHNIYPGRVEPDAEPFAIGDSIDDVRAQLPPGLIQSAPSPRDDKVIREVWL